MPTDPSYSITELASLGGVTSRTIRYYVSVGLLPAPEGAGRATRYGQDHLDRVRLIRRLQEQHLPLAEIRSRLATLSPTEVAATLAAPEPRPAGSALDYIRSLTDAPRHRLAPPMAPHAEDPAAPGPAPTARLAPAPAAMAPPVPSRIPPSNAMWERIPLGPDVELHVRRPLGRTANKRVERLVIIAKEILEDPS